jgi:S1-C subfamily serine protease
MKKIITCFFMLFAISSCNKMQIIKPELIEYHNRYENNLPEPIILDKVSYSLPRGAVIGKRMLSLKCSSSLDSLVWKGIRKIAKEMSYQDLFFEEMSLRGYDVVGDPGLMYGVTSDKKRARYRIGAQIRGIKLNECNHRSFYWLKGVSGEGEMTVFWQVYSVAKKEIVMSIKTRGYYKLKNRNLFGREVLLNEAFASAANKLANNEEFQKLIFSKPRNKRSLREKWPFKGLEIKKANNFKDKIQKNMNRVMDSTVFIRTATGHGSGFFISKDGYLLTNYHVVGDVDSVVVENQNGLVMDADIIRVHKSRDIALLKVDVPEGLKLPFLPTRDQQAELGETVYAVGTPLLTSLKNTLSKGMVSSWRQEEGSHYELIQTDIDVQPGNSGGPLLDDKGNLLAICVSGIGEYSIGINFFIPIKDAINKLNIVFN